MATKRRVRRAMCGQKQAFATHKEAATAAWHVRQKTGQNIWPYPCPFCKHYHYGHPPKGTYHA